MEAWGRFLCFHYNENYPKIMGIPFSISSLRNNYKEFFYLIISLTFSDIFTDS
ncbi:hypothetical protein FB550_109218 [Neobacillus bataviensis]|uniref:Uncharacterized protein n=1 Tax=Neobacillus bataviensis TaxID=220685 RepID=A0A561D658_9BACI|nr:hypothetical protein FB550_109218 [Neobacillus bataviensis]